MVTALFKTSLVLPAATQPQLPPQMLAQLCAGDRPLALFPVRLETRFFAQPDGGSELRVRVYPDKIHIDSHETDLTPSEKQWGEHYWEQAWRAGNDAQAQANAWRQLADRFEASRAAWIVRALRPVNLQERPATPVPQNQPPKPLQFPPVTMVSDGQDAAWRHAPQARFLPDRWVAIVHSGGRPVLAVTGREIARPLAVGPDPRAAAATVGDDQAAVDAGMRWMIDFDSAEAAGMALRIRLSSQLVAAGIDSLFVLGAAASATAADTALQLSHLLDAHHYTDGLDFVRPGTPSNNTAERRSGYSSEDPGHERSFATEIATIGATLDAQTNAQRLGSALGLPSDRIASVLGSIGEATQRHELDMRSMNTALWQATWGYFLTNMVGMHGTGLTPEIIAWAREHFVTHVRSGGPYAPIRCGKQPYGVLPVTSLDLWRPRAGEEAALARDTWLRGFLIKLRDNVWRVRLSEVARVGRRQDPSDPDADLADVMRTDATSNGYSARSLLGRHYLQHLRAFLGEDLQASGFIGVQDALTAGIVQRLGFTWRPRLARATYADMSWRVSAPLVQSGEISPWRGLEPNYIAALLAEPQINGLVGAQPSEGTSLLQALLRHSMLLEYANASAAIAGSQAGATVAALLKDEELVDLVTGAPPTNTWKRQLDLKVGAITGDRTIREHLESLTAFQAPSVAALGAFRESLAHLQGLDSEALQYSMQGTLDLAAHRLDAWITSFAAKRLASMRATQPQGVYAGGYGWVENLKPAPPAVVGSSATIAPPPGEQAPLVAQANDSGFIHAPSMAHAATAALLRNAHLGSSGVPQPSGPFAIDLSSRRVREAKWLLDGVRQGQPLGALLGYRFERRLHELTMDRFIQPLRQLAPLAAGKLEQTALPLETIAANNVVDGLVLHQKWRDNAATVTSRLQQAGATGAVITALGKELDALGESVDAVSDALTAEAAYQMVRGNTSRTASTLHALASGDAPAPELEVARTPRSGIALTHRLLLLFGGKPTATTGWVARSRSVRATAAPILNAWAAKLLGDPRKVRCVIERLDEPSGAVAETRTLPLSELQLAPLDVVYGVDAQPRAGQLSNIEQHVLYHARHKAGGFSVQARLHIQHARPADLGAKELTLLDVLEQARAARRLFASARAADVEDLTPPERATSGTLDLTQLEARVVKAEKALQSAHKALDTLVKRGAGADAESLRKALLKLNGFGLASAIPAVAAGDEDAARAGLLLQATALLKESKGRIDQVKALSASPAAIEPRPRRDHWFERMRAAFGSSFLVMPLFTCDHGPELASALAASTQVQDGDALAAHTWFARSERVRDAVARLGAPLRGAEVLATGDRLNLRVAQLPFNAGERWVGLPAEPGKDLPAGKLSLVVQAPAAIDTAQALAGLLVDEWVEVVPSRSETTAITFQFNPPDACAPQSVLVAVPPVPDAPWTVADLHRVLVETLDMAKLRAVDSEALGELAHYLPALFFAFNANDEAVSTDFAPLTR